MKPGTLIDDPSYWKREDSYRRHIELSRWHRYRIGLIPERINGRWRSRCEVERKGVFWLPEDSPPGKTRISGWAWEFREVQPAKVAPPPPVGAAYDAICDQWIWADGRREAA